MIDRPTPETDAAWAAESGNGLNEVKEISRKLERERDEARDAILGWENKWKCAVDMAARAELERDEALSKLNDLKNILR